MKNNTLTVFTTTYNRRHLLPRLYESLCKQTSQDFMWLIIDDGSTDGTSDLVNVWIQDKKISIQYIFKENGGMHTGHNMAYKHIETELNVCIDSDDYMPYDAVKKIVSLWNLTPNKSNIAGVIGLDAFEGGSIVGSKIPEGLLYGSLDDLYKTHGVTGDKKVVLRTEIVEKYPQYPEYPDERLVPLGTLYLMIGQDYNFIYSNEIYCIVEYQEEGSSNTIFKQYIKSPKGFAYARKLHIKHARSFLEIAKSYTHLISSSIFAKDLKIAFSGVNSLLTILFYPLGLLLNAYIRLKVRL